MNSRLRNGNIYVTIIYNLEFPSLAMASILTTAKNKLRLTTDT